MLNKLIEVSKRIADSYEDLSNMELLGLKDNLRYKKIVEQIDLYKYLEDIYYKKTENYSLNILEKYMKSLQIDDIICKDMENFDFVISNIIYEKDNDAIAKRRVWNKLNSIIYDKQDIDTLLLYLEEVIGDVKNEAIEVNGREIYICDRVHRVYEFIDEIDTNIYLRLLKQIQYNINNNYLKRVYTKSKYQLIFLDEKLENEINDYEVENATVKSNQKNYLDRELYNHLDKLLNNYLITNVVEYMGEFSDSECDIKQYDNYIIFSLYETFSKSLSSHIDTKKKIELANELENYDQELVKKRIYNTIK